MPKPKVRKQKRVEDINEVVDEKPVAAPVEDPDDSAAQTAVSFSELGLQSWLVQQCHAMKLKNPTPVQARCIPEILKGEHVLMC